MRLSSRVTCCGIRSFRGSEHAGGLVITYVVKARIDGRQRWITLGRHGPLTPYEARARARKMLGQIDSGEDPTRERDGRRGIPIFSEFAERWLREHIELKRKPATAAEYRRIIHRTLNPALGRVRVDRIDRTDAIDLHASMAGAPYVFNWFIENFSGNQCCHFGAITTQADSRNSARRSSA